MPVDYTLANPEEKSFADLMAFKEIDLPGKPKNSWVFQSTVVPWRPMMSRGVFGGHVLAQCACVGSATVNEGFICHNIHGYFLLPANHEIPFIYIVERLRDGRTYCSRHIRVFQFPKSVAADFDYDPQYIAFEGMLSWKIPEPTILNHQLDLDPELLAHDIEKVPVAPEIDVALWEQFIINSGEEESIHPIDFRKQKMYPYNKNIEQVANRRQINYFRSHYALGADPNLHVAALMYSSDRNSLFTILNVQDEARIIKTIASIDQTFVLHNFDFRVDKDWLTMCTWSERSCDSRGLYNGHIYDSKHRLLCSFMQDGVLRVHEETFPWPESFTREDKDDKEGKGEAKAKL